MSHEAHFHFYIFVAKIIEMLYQIKRSVILKSWKILAVDMELLLMIKFLNL